jgi:transporter family-2 protein
MYKEPIRLEILSKKYRRVSSEKFVRCRKMMGFLIALLSGALMSVQGVFNTKVTEEAGMWVSNAWVQLSAFAVCLVAWLVTGRDSVAALGRVEPKYMLLGGVIGAGITWTVIKSVAALGPAKSALLIVIAQLTVAYVIELFGMFGMDKEPLEWRKVGGLILALIGIGIFQWK